MIDLKLVKAKQSRVKWSSFLFLPEAGKIELRDVKISCFGRNASRNRQKF